VRGFFFGKSNLEKQAGICYVVMTYLSLSQQGARILEFQQPKVHDVTREEHTRMKQSLETVRAHFRHKKKLSEVERQNIDKGIDFLDHVLEFSGTWNGVETKEFFPADEGMQAFLKAGGIERLGAFFAKPYSELSQTLRAGSLAYPPVLQKIYEAYFLQSIKKRVRHELVP
jgi:hypothetical protein